MYALSPVSQPVDLAQIAFDSLRERICLLDCDGAIILTNHAWSQSARENGADPNRCGQGVNYLQVCRTAMGQFSEHALEAAIGIETVLRGATAQFTLDYACPSLSRQAWFRLIARPLRRPQSGAIILHSEITGQVVLAEKLRRTQAHYSALLENPVDAATVLAANGNIRYQSPASECVLGLGPEELSGHSIFEFVHPDDADPLRKVLRDCLRYPSRKQVCQYRFRKRDGSWLMLEGIARRLLSDPAVGIILNSRDITYQKIAEKKQLAKQDALERSHEELEALAARLFREQEDERRRMAAELNGNLSQRLASVSLQAAYLGVHAANQGQSHDLQERVAGLGRDLHALAGVLYPAILDHFGLAVALREFCTEFTHREGIPVTYGHRGISARLPGHTAVTLYRIAEEALRNVARHAHAGEAWVTLSRTAKGIRMSVRDEGAGFDPVAVESGSGLGILAMRERLRAVKGSLSVRSHPGAGTEVVAVVPLLSAVNQPCAAITGNVIVGPLDQPQQPVEFHQIHQVHEQTHEPGNETGEMPRAEIRSGPIASDRR